MWRSVSGRPGTLGTSRSRTGRTEVFTGIVEEVGTVVAREDQADAARLRIRAAKVLEDVALGDSISVSGVCLTVTDVEDGVWGTDVMAETLRRSSLGAAVAGGQVNLERAVTAHTRLGGDRKSTRL